MVYIPLRSRCAIAVVRLLAVALAGAGAACATTAPAGGSEARPARNLVAADLYPLDVGWKWAYDVQKDGQSMLALYAVLERTAGAALVQAGEENLTYAVSAEGVAQKDGPVVGDFVIKNPIQVGAEWPVVGGRARIAAVAQSVTVTAGKFDDCVVVEARRTDPARVVRTTFAPGTGPVIIELQIQVAGELTTVTRATLRAVTKPGQDPLG